MVTTRADFWSATTARARRFASPQREFLRTERGGAAVLLAATAAPLGGMGAAAAISRGSSAAEAGASRLSTDTAFALRLLTPFGRSLWTACGVHAHGRHRGTTCSRLS